MSTFAAPLAVNAGLQGMASPNASVPADQIVAGALAGTTLRGGAPFTDTLPGLWYPFVIDAFGNVTLSGSGNNPKVFILHNTQFTTLGDAVLYPGRTTQSGSSISAPTIAPYRVGGMANFDFSLLDFNGIGDVVGWGFQAASIDGSVNASAIFVAERLANDAHAVARTRYYQGVWSGGFDNTGTTMPMAVQVKAGVPLDTDFSNGQYGVAPPNGTLVIDSTNNKIWVRIGGVWKGVVVA